MMTEQFSKSTELQGRLTRLTLDRGKLEARIEEVTAQRNEAAAQVDKGTVTEHQQTLDRLHAELEATTAGLALVQDRVKETREQEGAKAARARCEAIVAEAQEAAAEYERAATTMLECARAYDTARTKFLEAFEKTKELRLEENALCHRFELARSKLPVIPVPARHPVLAQMPFVGDYNWPDNAHKAEATQRCEHQMRTRRTYKECSRTEGFEIITGAGLRPFAELNARQRELLAEKERDNKREAEIVKRMQQETELAERTAALVGPNDPLGRGA
jgi:hypothetical protein